MKGFWTPPYDDFKTTGRASQETGPPGPALCGTERRTSANARAGGTNPSAQERAVTPPAAPTSWGAPGVGAGPCSRRPQGQGGSAKDALRRWEAASPLHTAWAPGEGKAGGAHVSATPTNASTLRQGGATGTCKGLPCELRADVGGGSLDHPQSPGRPGRPAEAGAWLPRAGGPRVTGWEGASSFPSAPAEV